LTIRTQVEPLLALPPPLKKIVVQQKK